MAKDAVDAAGKSLGSVLESRTAAIELVGGDRDREIDELVRGHPNLSQPLGDSRYIHADVVYAVQREGALHLDDILTRRTRISIETADRGINVARTTAELVAPHLGWSAEDIEREVEHYVARVEAEIDSQTRPDDRTADAARMGASDVRRGSAG